MHFEGIILYIAWCVVMASRCEVLEGLQLIVKVYYQACRLRQLPVGQA